VKGAEESPLLEAVARERLLKTQQAGKCLAGAVVICKVRRSAIAMLHVFPSRVNISIHQSMARL
jgi:hypothetical protein